jgi:CDP-diglyceride synthetase
MFNFIHNEKSLFVVPVLSELTFRKCRKIIFTLLLQHWQHQEIHNATACIFFYCLATACFDAIAIFGKLKTNKTKIIKTYNNKQF